jgi:hypothetical protein
MEQAVNYFAVFGGLDVKIDMNKPLNTLIKRHILDQYYDIHDEVDKLIKTDNIGYKILSGVALGDRRINSAFKRADVDYDEGIEIVHKLIDKEVISEESSFDHVTNEFEQNEAADKLILKTPFLRFWFAFVSPLYRGIKREEYDEVYERIEKRKAEFMEYIFESLCHEYLKQAFKEEGIEEIGRFWNAEHEIQLLAQTTMDDVIIGSCSYSNTKIKKNEINRIKSLCETLEISPTYVTLFSKKGFSKELKDLKGQGLRLFTVKSLKALL